MLKVLGVCFVGIALVVAVSSYAVADKHISSFGDFSSVPSHKGLDPQTPGEACVCCHFIVCKSSEHND